MAHGGKIVKLWVLVWIEIGKPELAAKSGVGGVPCPIPSMINYSINLSSSVDRAFWGRPRLDELAAKLRG
jgi:hypothetical protein